MMMLAHATHDEVSLLLVIALVALSAGILFGLQLASRSLGTRSKKR